MKILRVKGFTLLEVTIAMLVTGIVIGITYMIYLIVLKSFDSFNEKTKKLQTLTDFDHILSRDFDRADTVFKDSAGVKILNNGATIRYSFYPDFILRESTKTDTFNIVSGNVVTKFESVPIDNLQTDAESNRIDQLDLVLIMNSDSIPGHYFKYYSSEDLFHRNPNAIH